MSGRWRDGHWYQVDGDMNPGAHGGVLARFDGDVIELREIQPTRAYVGDDEAAGIGFPFWSRDGAYAATDLDPDSPDVEQAMRSSGLAAEKLPNEPRARALAIAVCCLNYGWGVVEGPCGWARDVVPDRVLWWSSKRPRGWRHLADEDRDFRELLQYHTCYFGRSRHESR